MARPTLSPYAFTTLERARGYLKRPASILDDPQQDIIVAALNAIVGLFEGAVGRNLACRTYRNTATITCGTTINTTALTGTGLTALKSLDDAVGAGLEVGTRLASITSAAAAVLSKPATATGSTSVTFGSEPLITDGHGLSWVYIPERPVVEVYSVKWVDSQGTKTAFDLTNARLDRATGRYQIVNDAFPRGSGNIEIECKAGYREPAATDRGDWSGWSQLEGLALRACQVMFQDFEQAAGRTGEITLAAATMKIQDFKLPEDIAQGLAMFNQPW